MIAELLPSYVVTEHAFDDVAEPALFPEEAAIVARAVEKRRKEFATTRACAHAALARLGAPAGPLLSGKRGQPVWPSGVVGSMTHCDGYRAAAVASRDDVRAVGIDAEPNDVLPDGVLRLVSREEERRAMEAAPTGLGVHWDRLIFSAKEAVFKAWYPLTGRELTFQDVSLDIDPVGGEFSASFLVEDAVLGEVIPGRWLCRAGLVVTGVCVPAG